MEDIFHLGIKAVIRNAEGKILLLKVNPKKLKGDKRDYWDLPGGRVQKGSSVLETLRREIEEETGITNITKPEEIGMVLSTLRIPLGQTESAGLILNIYTCNVPLHATIHLSDEHISYDWFTPEKAANLLTVKYPESFCQHIASL